MVFYPNSKRDLTPLSLTRKIDRMIISLPSRRTVHFWRELSAIIPNIDPLYYCIIMANEDEILTYKPLAADSTVSANPHIPSVSASAVLGESDSVRCVLYDCMCV